ncbi:hypothetical protein GYMLUDRAFT_41105 [Collybiopsis luxurians FD-317 M1]|uniref:F-box domain-containing protein n=1 Tax=Collybiopsis luxurians FD-317 M1 TaxID=944289 RepID=A0A0D0BHH1_9AGAR|nr:hypothetical protein GYMLUDRAFT_41105 [Collybiopsis luxurians FD-317 M1]
MRFYQTPIHTLPVELLSYIFVLGTHSPPELLTDEKEQQELLPFNTESVKTPLIFSAVCRRWREVAQNSPSLWTSICVTAGSVEESSEDQTKRLNLSHITSYLSFSKRYPLNILLDTRDIDWDFCEPEIFSTSELSDYVPPFSKDDMRTVISLLLPHLFRWQSIEILTDTWAPMHTALCMLNGPLLVQGAPLLESLVLMRCNDYISHSPQFQPSRMKSPALFSSESASEPTNDPILPRLRNLTLRGVHVDWPGLCNSLSPSLNSLELSSHSLDVRPTHSEFHDMLLACPKLSKLTLNGSGFVSDDEDLSLKTGVHALRGRVEPVSLPLLESLRIGYRSAFDGCDILSSLHAPDIKQLSLEDATHPGEVEVVEADSLLLCLAELKRGQRRTVYPTASHSDASSSCLCKTEPNSALYPFPNLQKVVLKGMRAQSNNFRRFLMSTPRLQSLELQAVPRPMDVIAAMVPSWRLYTSQTVSGNTLPSSIPCPLLEEIRLQRAKLSTEDLGFLTQNFLAARAEIGAGCLKRLDIHLVGTVESQFHFSDRLSLRIFESPLAGEDDDESSIGDSSENVDAQFQYGGVFNDPIFDAQYNSIFSH